MNDYSTRGQRFVLLAIVAAMLAALLGGTALNLRAAWTCAPRAGKWTPWTGAICYGEHDAF